MVTIASLVYSIVADSKKFTSGMNQVGKSSKKAETDIQKVTNKVNNLVKAFVGIQTARMAWGGIREEFNRVDEIVKTSEKLGVLNNELVTMRLAAEDFSRMGSQQFDTALQRMTRRVSEAAAGTGEAQKAIEELGLSAEELNRVGPAQAFRDIADAISEVQNPADQLRLAFKFFDSEGAALVTTLNKGSEALDQAAEKARQLGLTFSDDVAQSAVAANQALNDLEKEWSAFMRGAAQAIAPEVIDVLNLLRDIGGMGMSAFRWTQRQLTVAGAAIPNAIYDVPGFTGSGGPVPLLGGAGQAQVIADAILSADGRAQRRHLEAYRTQREQLRETQQQTQAIERQPTPAPL